MHLMTNSSREDHSQPVLRTASMCVPPAATVQQRLLSNVGMLRICLQDPGGAATALAILTADQC
jgi:hypothetical protein